MAIASDKFCLMLSSGKPAQIHFFPDSPSDHHQTEECFWERQTNSIKNLIETPFSLNLNPQKVKSAALSQNSSHLEADIIMSPCLCFERHPSTSSSFIFIFFSLTLLPTSPTFSISTLRKKVE